VPPAFTDAAAAPAEGPAAAARGRATRMPGRIGPNAVLQVPEALHRAGLAAMRAAVFRAAGETGWLAEPPARMVDERRVAALHAAVLSVLGPARGTAVLRGAGRLTADYVIAHRIPRAARAVLAGLPRPLATRALARLVTAHAFTFAGSGRLAIRCGEPVVLHLSENPIAVAVPSGGLSCAYHAGAFERLCGRLLAAPARLEAADAPADGACRIVISLSRPGPQHP